MEDEAIEVLKDILKNIPEWKTLVNATPAFKGWAKCPLCKVEGHFSAWGSGEVEVGHKDNCPRIRAERLIKAAEKKK
jgi:hypothetical protein